MNNVKFINFSHRIISVDEISQVSSRENKSGNQLVISVELKNGKTVIDVIEDIERGYCYMEQFYSALDVCDIPGTGEEVYDIQFGSNQGQ